MQAPGTIQGVVICSPTPLNFWATVKAEKLMQPGKAHAGLGELQRDWGKSVFTHSGMFKISSERMEVRLEEVFGGLRKSHDIKKN